MTQIFFLLNNMNIAGDFGDKRPKIFEQTVHT